MLQAASTKAGDAKEDEQEKDEGNEDESFGGERIHLNQNKEVRTCMFVTDNQELDSFV